MSLRLDGVTVRYGHRTAVDAISLVLEPGITGLLGPNGAGKSTLLRVLATLQRPAAGRVTLDELDIAAAPDALRARLGYLPQDFGLYPALTVGETVAHFARLKRVSDAAGSDGVLPLLARVGLADRASTRVAALSGGMRQRLGLAIALLGRPRLLLLDEPTAGLDPAERHRLHDVLAEAAEGAVLLLSTHLVEDVAALAARVVVLAGGRVVADAAPEALVAGLAGRVWTGAAKPPPEVMVLAARRVGGARVVRVAHPSAPGVAWTAAEPTLEDAYFAALRGAGAA